MATYPTIQLYQGATSVVEIDLSNFELQGGTIVVTMRSKGGKREVIRTWEFDRAIKHEIVFTDEFTATLKLGSQYEYDIMWHLDNERFAQCEPSDINVSRTVGGWSNESSTDGQ